MSLLCKGLYRSVTEGRAVPSSATARSPRRKRTVLDAALARPPALPCSSPDSSRPIPQPPYPYERADDSQSGAGVGSDRGASDNRRRPANIAVRAATLRFIPRLGAPSGRSAANARQPRARASHATPATVRAREPFIGSQRPPSSTPLPRVRGTRPERPLPARPRRPDPSHLGSFAPRSSPFASQRTPGGPCGCLGRCAARRRSAPGTAPSTAETPHANGHGPGMAVPPRDTPGPRCRAERHPCTRGRAAPCPTRMPRQAACARRGPRHAPAARCPRRAPPARASALSRAGA